MIQLQTSELEVAIVSALGCKVLTQHQFLYRPIKRFVDFLLSSRFPSHIRSAMNNQNDQRTMTCRQRSKVRRIFRVLICTRLLHVIRIAH